MFNGDAPVVVVVVVVVGGFNAVKKAPMAKTKRFNYHSRARAASYPRESKNAGNDLRQTLPQQQLHLRTFWGPNTFTFRQKRTFQLISRRKGTGRQRRSSEAASARALVRDQRIAEPRVHARL